MKHTRLIPIIIVAIMLFNCFMPFTTVFANTNGSKTIELNGELYEAVKTDLLEKGINASFNDKQRKITISAEELAKVTTLDLSESGISNIKGLENFANLVELDLSSNELTKESELSVLSNLNLKMLDLSSNKIEDVNSITNLDSIQTLNIHDQEITEVHVITPEDITGEKGTNEVLVLCDVPEILSRAGYWGDYVLPEEARFEGNDPGLRFEYKDITNGKVYVKAGGFNQEGKFIPNKGLLKLHIEIKDSNNPLNNTNITLYYLVIDENQRAAIFKDANLYNKVKEQLTQSPKGQEYNNYNEDLRTYIHKDEITGEIFGENGETLYQRAYDEPMILVLGLDELINEIPTLKVSNSQVKDLSGIETFVGLKNELDVSYNYIESIEKIIELQKNKEKEELKLQERFKEQIAKLNKVRSEFMEYYSQFLEFEKQIQKAKDSITNLEKYIAELELRLATDTSLDEKTRKALEETKAKAIGDLEGSRDGQGNFTEGLREKVRKELEGYTNEKGEKIPGLYEKRDEAKRKAMKLLPEVYPEFKKLNEVYRDDYKCLTLLPHDVDEITDSKELLIKMNEKISKYESAKNLSDIDTLVLSMYLAKAGIEIEYKNIEGKEIENPISTTINKLIEKDRQIVEAKNAILEADSIIQSINYLVLNYNDTELLEVEYDEILNEKIEEILEEKENGTSSYGYLSIYNDSYSKAEAIQLEIEELRETLEELKNQQNNLKMEDFTSVEAYIAAMEKNEIHISELENEITKLSKASFEYKKFFIIEAFKVLKEELAKLERGEVTDISLSYLVSASGKFVSLTEEEIKAYVQLPKLKVLDITNNIIEEIEGIEELINLKELYAGENEISNLSNVKWESMKKLEVLDLHFNMISDIKPLESIKSLKGLDVSNNLLAGRFDFYIVGLPKIEKLNFSKNQYTDLTDFIEQFKGLALNEEVTVAEYLADFSGITVLFYDQELSIPVGSFVIKDGESKVQNVKLPPIMKQLEELDPSKTIFGTESIYGKVRADGTVGLIISNEEGKHTGKVTVLTHKDSDRYSIGDGTCVELQYEVMTSKVNRVTIVTEEGTIANEVELGKAIQLKAKIDGTNVEDTSVSWTLEGQTSENTKIDENGMLTVGIDEVPGTEIIIKATSNYDSSVSSDEVKIKIVKLKTEVIIPTSTTEKGLEQGSTKAYTAKVETEAEDKSVKWEVEGQTSENTKIDENGMLTIGEDEVAGTKITVKAISNYDETKEATVKEIVIEKIKPLEIKINETATEKGLQQGATKTYTVTVTTEAEDKTVIWSVEGNKSKNTKVDANGKLTIGEDEVAGTKITVKATSNYDNTKIATVEETVVEKVKAVEIKINETATKEGLEPGATKVYTATVTTEAEDKTVTWSVEGNKSENTKVDTNGKLTIGEDEVAGTKITVKATSNYDNTKVAIVEEIVIAAKVQLNKPTKETTVFEQKPNATVSSFVEELVEEGNTVKVVDKDGNEVLSTAKLATGMKVIVNDKEEYTLVVTGDINYDGKVDSLDSEMIKAARLGSLGLADVQEQAADINADGKVNRIDSFIMLLYRAGSKDVRDFTAKTIENIMK